MTCWKANRNEVTPEKCAQIIRWRNTINKVDEYIVIICLLLVLLVLPYGIPDSQGMHINYRVNQ
jgi:hypothetical protein